MPFTLPGPPAIFSKSYSHLLQYVKRPREGGRKKAAGDKKPIAAYQTDYDSWGKFNPDAEEEDEDADEEEEDEVVDIVEVSPEEQEKRYRERMAETNATDAREKGNG